MVSRSFYKSVALEAAENARYPQAITVKVKEVGAHAPESA
jgi:hypothetical protein